MHALGLGLPHDQVLDTPLPFVALAVRGRSEMLRMFADYILTPLVGPPAGASPEPPDTAQQAHDIFGRMMSED